MSGGVGVLVTGGAGFVGSHLVERLVDAGERVAVLDDLSRGRRAWLRPEVELHQVDIRDAAAVRGVVAAAAPEVVLHLAAMHFIPAVDGAPEVARAVNVGGTKGLLDALRDRPPRLLLFASTAAVYPDRAGQIAEACPPEPRDLYGGTKLEGERLVSRFADETGARCVVARIFNVVGPRETNAHVVPEVVEQLRHGAAGVRLGNLDSRRDYTDVRDVADALLALLEVAGEERLFNVGSGRSVSVRDLVDICAEVLGRPVAIGVDPERLRPVDRHELVADTRRLRHATGWEPRRSLEETLAELLAPVGVA